MDTRRKLYFIFLLSAVISYSGNAQNLNSENIPLADSLSLQNEIFYPIILNHDTLFTINTNLGPYSPDERAKGINLELKDLSRLERIHLDSFLVSEKAGYSVISYKQNPIIYISDNDGASFGKTRQELAEERLSTIREGFSQLLKQRTGVYWIKRIGFTLLAIAGLVVIFMLLNRTFRWISRKLSTYEQGILRKRNSILRFLLPKNTPNIFLLLSKLVKIILVILILVFYLPLIFSFFPWTEHLVNQFYGYISEPISNVGKGLLNYLPNLFYIFVIVVIARYLIRFLNALSVEIEEDRLRIKGFHKDWAQPTANIIKIILYAFTLVFIFPYLPGSDSPAFRGVSIFLGVLFSLGSTSAIANIVAGIVITYMRPFAVGDRVKIGESVGDILEKNLLVTRIRTIKNEDITIPNATIINTHLWNYSKSASSMGIILHTSVTIGYDVPAVKVNDLLMKAAQNTKNLSREFKPFVLHKTLADFYVEYELNVYTKQPKKMAQLKSELNFSILEEFNKAGVEILSPHYNSYRDGNGSTIHEPNAPVDPEPGPGKNIINQIVGKATGQK